MAVKLVINYNTHVIVVTPPCGGPPICEEGTFLVVQDHCAQPTSCFEQVCAMSDCGSGGFPVWVTRTRPAAMVTYPMYQLNEDGDIEFYIDDKLNLIQDRFSAILTIAYIDGVQTTHPIVGEKRKHSLRVSISTLEGGCTSC